MKTLLIITVAFFLVSVPLALVSIILTLNRFNVRNRFLRAVLIFIGGCLFSAGVFFIELNIFAKLYERGLIKTKTHDEMKHKLREQAEIWAQGRESRREK